MTERTDPTDSLTASERIRIGIAVILSLVMLVVVEIQFPRPIGEHAIVIGPFVGIVAVIVTISVLANRRAKSHPLSFWYGEEQEVAND